MCFLRLHSLLSLLVAPMSLARSPRDLAMPVPRRRGDRHAPATRCDNEGPGERARIWPRAEPAPGSGLRRSSCRSHGDGPRPAKAFVVCFEFFSVFFLNRSPHRRDRESSEILISFFGTNTNVSLLVLLDWLLDSASASASSILDMCNLQKALLHV